MQPLVSVCVLTWNHENYVEQCLQSIVEQDYGNIEIVYLDNCSTDSTFDRAVAFLERQAIPVQYSRNEAPASISVNANRNLQKARGKYVCIISGDDWMAPQNISKKMARMLADDGVALVYSEAVTFYEAENCYVREFNPRACEGRVFDKLLLANFITAPGVLLDVEKVAAVGWFNDQNMIEDWDLWLRLSQRYKIAYVKDHLVYYRRHSSNVSQLDNIPYIKEKLKVLEPYKGINGYYRGKEDVVRQLILATVNKKEFRNAFAVLCRHTKVKPFYLQQWVKFFLAYLVNGLRTFLTPRRFS